MKRTFSVLNVKCGNCANTLKKSLKDEFGEVEVNLEVTPREITLDIEESDFEKLGKKLKTIGYPLENEKMGFIENSTVKVKSYISCAMGASS